MPTSTALSESLNTANGTKYIHADYIVGGVNYGRGFLDGGSPRQFYPDTGRFMTSDSGIGVTNPSLVQLEAEGTYATTTSGDTGGANALWTNQMNINFVSRTNGIAVRCMPNTTPPTEGPDATEGILAVNNKGQLNLDGQSQICKNGITTNKIVYFKYGSLIAISGSNTGSDAFDSSDIAWRPAGYPTGDITSWGNIPFASGSTEAILTTPNATAGKGDPCMLAMKGGVQVTGWRMPQANPYELVPVNGNSGMGAETTIGGVAGRTDLAGRFYPYARFRNNSGLSQSVVEGHYWANDGSDSALGTLFFTDGVVDNNLTRDRRSALPIRCMETPSYTQNPVGEVKVGSIAWAMTNVAASGVFAQMAEVYDGNNQYNYSQATANSGRGVCPTGWRPPTVGEFDALILAANERWATRSGIGGCEFVLPGGTLFFAASATKSDPSLTVGRVGFYGSSTSLSSDHVEIMQFGDNDGDGTLNFWPETINEGAPKTGSGSIRCVRDL
jgi:hypothetical protein